MRVAGIPLGVGNSVDGRIPFTIDWTGKTDWLNCQFSTASGLTDSSANNQSFTQYGTPAIGTLRNPSGALDLNGASSLSTVSAIAFSTQPYSISVDMFIETSSNYYSLFLGQRLTGGDASFELYSIANSKLLCINYFSDMGGIVAEYTGITRNEWHTVQVERFSDGTLKLGLDGFLVAQTSSLGNMISRVFNIGTDNTGDNSRATTGSIKNLRIAV
jgi:hypothetical protein